MKKLFFLVLLSFGLLLTACEEVNTVDSVDDEKLITSSTFFADTTITEYLLDAELTSSRPIENMEEDYLFFDRVEDSVGMLENFSYLYVDPLAVDVVSPCINEYCSVLMLPIIATNDVDDLSHWILYDEGNLCIGYSGTGDLNTEGNELKLLLVVIDSPYLFEATSNQSLCPYYK